MKKIIGSVLLSVIILSSLIQTSFAGLSQKPYIFKFSNGKQISYFLDENGDPYSIINNENVAIILPLEKYEVVDIDILDSLNEDVLQSKNTISMRSAPAGYYDLRVSPFTNSSRVYSTYISYAHNDNVYTTYLRFQYNHSAIRIYADELVRSTLFSSSKIHFVYYYYYEDADQWYSRSFNVSCNSTVNGYGFQHLPDTYTYGRFKFVKSSNIKNFTAKIWTTYAY